VTKTFSSSSETNYVLEVQKVPNFDMVEMPYLMMREKDYLVLVDVKNY
jgi:hypothetical protein